jgi:diguanylate cyclase (GGDEF)-like protein
MMGMVGLVVSIIAGIFAMNLYYFKEVEKSLTKQTCRDLKLENDKILNYLQNLTEAKFEWLELFAAICDLPDESGNENWWELLEESEKESSRLGIADNKGIIYYGNHKSADISSRTYFKKVLLGEKNISRLLPGGFEGQDGIVLAVPIIRDSMVVGAACLEYSAEELKAHFDDSPLNRNGANLLFTEEGQIMVSSSGVNLKNSIFDFLEPMEFRNGQSLEQMKQAVKNGEAGYITYYENNNKRLLYYQPTGIDDWVVASLVKTEMYESMLYRIRSITLEFITSSTIMLVSAVLLILGILHYRKKEEKRAQKDYLTGVYTRETARKLVSQGLKGVGNKRFYACMFLDIDDFKKINDTFGHHKGDLVLIEVGQILSACTRQEDVIVRFGGDEFCIWLYGMRGRKQPEAIAARILNAFNLSGSIHASIGITQVGENENDYDAILRRADEALYEAKGKGKNQYAVKR